jgi:hypothetical protein
VSEVMQPVATVAASLTGHAYERVKVMHGGSFRNARTVVIAPTRGMIHHRTVASWQALIAPMNQARAFIICAGDEVGVAYNKMIANILADPNLSKWDYVMTLEDDNLVPPDAHIRLLESIEDTGADAVSGIYFTKGDFNAPMAYGDPAEYARTNVLDFRPRTPEEIRAALERGHVMPVNGIAMGCALWKMSLFRDIPAPWFVTVSDLIGGSVQCFTQDLKFCETAVRAGKRFAVDFRVKVGHMDVKSGEVY